MSRRNPFTVITNVVRKEGFRALYVGCTTMIAGTMAKDALRFLTFSYIKTLVIDPNDPNTVTPLRNIASGMAAGVVASTFAVTPSERVKTALIDDARSPGGGRRFTGPLSAMRVLVAESGPLALYRGYVTTTIKQAGATAMRLGTYAILKDYEAARAIAPTTAITFANGAVAGVVTTYATQPVDTIKTRAQSVRGAGIGESARDIWREFGVRGFWRGTTMRLGRTVVSGGILFSVFEWVVTLVEAAKPEWDGVSAGE